MRLCLALLASLSLVACGGGDDADRPDAGPRPDARIDAEPSPDCLFGTEYGITLGSMTAPATFNGSFGQDDMGNWVVAVFGGLNGLEGEPASFGNHGITILLVDNTGMFLDTPFGTVPTGEAITLNGIEADDACGGCLFGYSGMPSDTPPQDPGNVPTQAYLADAGSLTFTTFGDIIDDADPLTMTDIFLTYDGVMLTGYDYTTGEALTPACASNVDLGVFLRVNFDSTATFAPMGKAVEPLVANQQFVVTQK